MKIQNTLAGAALVAGLVFSGFALAQDADGMAECMEGVKANAPADQYTEEGAQAFCTCLGEKAAADPALAAEFEANRGKTPEEAEATASEAAKTAVNSCLPPEAQQG